MKLVDAVAIRLQNILKEKNSNYYRVQRDGGVERSTVSDIAQAKNKTVVLNTLYAIITTLGVTLEEFFNDPIFDNIYD